MAYPREEYSDFALREKMKKWGVFKEDPSELIIPEFLTWGELHAPVEPFSVMSEIRDIKKRVRELETRVGGKRQLTKADTVYELFKKKLEEEHFGKIVAIDTESKEIAGIGRTISEAYYDAKEKTGKDQFDFRRVGYKYVFKV